MLSNYREETLSEVFRAVFDGLDQSCAILNPGRAGLSALGVLDPDDMPVDGVDMVITKETERAAQTDFKIGSRVANHLADESLRLRVVDTGQLSFGFCVSSPDGMYAIVTGLDDGVAALSTTPGESLHPDVHDLITHQFEGGDEANLRSPALSTVLQTFEEKFGDETRAVYETLLNDLDEVSSDTVHRAELLLAASSVTNEMNFTVSRWAEKVGYSSKATVSRNKVNMEEEDLITTSNIPADVGRPRQKLQAGPAINDDAPPLEQAQQIVEHLRE